MNYPSDPHVECNAEIAALRAELAEKRETYERSTANLRAEVARLNLLLDQRREETAMAIAARVTESNRAKQAERERDEARFLAEARASEAYKNEVVVALRETAGQLDALREAVRTIREKAHDASTGPAVTDVLWEIRSDCDAALDAAGGE